MKLTVEDLKALGACPEGIADFADVFPNGIDVPEWDRWCQTVVLGTKMRRWFGWAWHNQLIPLWSLSGADLSGADLSGADLYRANLSDNDPVPSGWVLEGGRLVKETG